MLLLLLLLLWRRSVNGQTLFYQTLHQLLQPHHLHGEGGESKLC
jgi:hypothetical protein